MSATTRPIRIGTRGSALAMVQAGIVRDALVRMGASVEVEVIVTAGDRRAPDTAWGEGAFVGAIEAALLEGQVDVAVHSAKDVPTDEDPRLEIAAFLRRADARDVVVTRHGEAPASLDELPSGCVVGTDSPRRTAFLRSLRPDLQIHPLHGNVDTRLRRLDAGETDALVLAAAGLERLGRAERISFRLEPDTLPPAPGQGALAVQVRTADHVTRNLVARLDDPPTHRAVQAERELLAAAGGGCRAPIGARAQELGPALQLVAGYARPEGDLRAIVHRSAVGIDDDAGLVETVLGDLARSAAGQAIARGWPRVIVTRPERSVAATALGLVDRGFAPRSVPAIRVVLEPGGGLSDALRSLAAFDWVVLTSASGVDALRAAARMAGLSLAEAARRSRARWAVVGRATARALAIAGIRPDVRPDREDAEALAEALEDVERRRVLLPRSDIADPKLSRTLAARGARVTEVVAYRTEEAPAGSRGSLRAALAEGPSALTLASPSAVRGLLALAASLGQDTQRAIRTIPAIAIGSTTAAEIERLGLELGAVAASPAPSDVAAATAELFQQREVPA